MRLLIVGLLLVLALDYSSSIWVKKYMENYHRPTYYNSRHGSKDHAEYNHEALEKRDEVEGPKRPSRPPFDPERHLTYYANVLHRASMICAGALISYRMVITSTNCFKPRYDDDSYVFKAKDMSVQTGGELSMVDQHAVIAFYMPESEKKMKPNSVALLALKTKLDRAYYRYIKLYHKIPKVGSHVKMAFVNPYDFKVNHKDTMILNLDRCQIYYGLRELFHIYTLNPDYICVRNKRHTLKETCSTRPGDPLLVGNQLAAINIYGEHCDLEDGSVNMDIYLPMRHVVKFIQHATDALRAFTHSGPYNASLGLPETPLIKALMKKTPNVYVGANFTEDRYNATGESDEEKVTD